LKPPATAPSSSSPPPPTRRTSLLISFLTAQLLKPIIYAMQQVY
jgi:hypothetical protein